MPINIRALGLPSKRLVASYILDWIVIIAIAAVGAGWNDITPYHRPFSVLDLSISFPYTDPETIPTWLLVVVALVVPAVTVFFVSLIFVPGPTANPSTPKTLIWRRKFWEWNTGWMGLGLSLATAFMLTQGSKLLFGKPRPDLLARCKPDLSRLQSATTGGYGQDISPRWVLVTSDICAQTDMDILNDGFKSFPSGHASSLEREQRLSFPLSSLRRQNSNKPSHASSSLDANTEGANPVVPIRNQAAAPPTWVLVLALVPLGAAIYITASRFFDFRHHGFDLIVGSTIGIVCAWFSFRWYHLPIRQGAGWAWGARSRDRAFCIGLGMGSYVGTEGWASAKDDDDYGRHDVGPAPDLEQGGGSGAAGANMTRLNGPGLDGQRDSGVSSP
ncbi:hypothetical protein SLS55_004715 [Diplodia seriata]|uniref:Phosphatidic acid phosphatase type 2/haloperoxidase domain-containing protein n=1 Tax=Diplodia seriata TaxID=420778 RepID=A0ABR3CK78_9PEZI